MRRPEWHQIFSRFTWPPSWSQITLFKCFTVLIFMWSSPHGCTRLSSHCSISCLNVNWQAHIEKCREIYSLTDSIPKEDKNEVAPSLYFIWMVYSLAAITHPCSYSYEDVTLAVSSLSAVLKVSYQQCSNHVKGPSMQVGGVSTRPLSLSDGHCYYDPQHLERCVCRDKEETGSMAGSDETKAN